MDEIWTRYGKWFKRFPESKISQENKLCEAEKWEAVKESVWKEKTDLWWEILKLIKKLKEQWIFLCFWSELLLWLGFNVVFSYLLSMILQFKEWKVKNEVNNIDEII